MAKRFVLLSFLLLTSALVRASDYRRGLIIRFDTPNTLQGRAVWYGGRPEMWSGDNKPETAGDTAQNPDREWESCSLPIGNGSIGANIMGSVKTERITFNEKTLWRGGPNTAKGAGYYWNVNKQSAHLLPAIRKAFAEGKKDVAERLTRENFNSEVPYEASREKPFRFGNFTTMGEFYVETDLNKDNPDSYRRILSIDSALAVVQFSMAGTDYRRSFFISYPANVMVMRFSANRAKRQNLVFSYAPNPLSTGRMASAGDDGLIYTGTLDNNGMQFVVRIRVATRGGTVSNADGKLSVRDADEVVF